MEGDVAAVMLYLFGHVDGEEQATREFWLWQVL
jgi:hypothetical protein